LDGTGGYDLCVRSPERRSYAARERGDYHRRQARPKETRMPDPLTESQIADALKQLPDWAHEGGMLARHYQFADFNEALGFMVRIGLLAEQQGHHPRLVNVYNRLSIELNTHDAGGQVTQKDVDLALAIQRLPAS